MVNFIAKFAPQVSEVTAPLRELIKKSISFRWLDIHDKAFSDLKSILIDSQAFRYYDVTKPVTLQVDASQHGLGAALIQDNGVIAYASKALNKTQRGHAQIKKELLAIVFGCKRFYQYVYGKTITIETDHKPLENIFRKPLFQAPSRLQKMLMQIQEYDINLVYKKGTEMYLADALSCAFPPELQEEQFEQDMNSERFIHLMSTASYVTDQKIAAIKNENHHDETIRKLREQIENGWPEHRSMVPADIRTYFPYRHDLTTHDDIIYKAHNILIPPKLRAETLNKLHYSHQGIEKTKRLACESIFWPGMSAEIDEHASKCDTCQTNANANSREPLKPHDIPQWPWQKVGTDLLVWKGKQHLIVADYYSRYPEVAELRNTKARTVISKTKSIFSRHGIPDEVISDNRPQYSSQEYRQFATDYDFTCIQR